MERVRRNDGKGRMGFGRGERRDSVSGRICIRFLISDDSGLFRFLPCNGIIFIVPMTYLGMYIHRPL